MLPFLAPILTQLASKGLQSVADAVLDKGKDYVEEKLGITLEPNMSEEKIAQIRSEAMKHEEFMVEAEMKDRDSARQREAAVANSDASWLSKNIVAVLAIGTIVFAFVIATILAFVDIVDNQKDILIYVLGFVTSAATQVLSYYFGSSQGSKDKTAELNALIKK
jgi:hypothetical protein